MEGMEQIVNLALNSGMSILITVYFLYRDWKYQSQIVETLAQLNEVMRSTTEAIKTLEAFHK